MKGQKIVFIPPIPIDQIAYPWNHAFQYLNQLSPLLPLRDPVMQTHIDMTEADWRIVLHYLVRKKWRIKTKLPIPKKLLDTYEPWAEFLCRAQELTRECYEKLTLEAKQELDVNYPNAANWFAHIIREAIKKDIQLAIENKAAKKTSLNKERKAILSDLRRSENHIDPQKFPHYYRQISAVFWLQDYINDDVKSWKPFCAAAKQWIKSMEQETSKTSWIEDGRIVHRYGRGPGIITLVSKEYFRCQDAC
jgi:hypothetical protein